MDEKRDELLVRKFFEENKIEIPDAGFSRRVMRRLPDRTRRLNRNWTAICVAVGGSNVREIRLVVIAFGASQEPCRHRNVKSCYIGESYSAALRAPVRHLLGRI